MSAFEIREAPQREFRLRGPLSRRALLRYADWRALRCTYAALPLSAKPALEPLPGVSDVSAIFDRLQTRLLQIAYRMLGSVSDAEDVVQDVWLRWHDAAQSEIQNAEAWLVAATTRRAIDRLRALKTQRETYVGIWLPEPVLTDPALMPDELKEATDEVSTALLVMLERLAPETRAAFLLREVFDADYADIAAILGKSEAACRQIVHRAKGQLQEAKARFVVAPDAHRRLMTRFAIALELGDFRQMRDMLSESAELVGDGGGIVTSFPKPMQGGQRIAQLLYSATLRFKDRIRIQAVEINGKLGVLRFIDDQLESAQSYETDGERIVQVYLQRNPHKLERLLAQLGAHA